MKQLGFVMEQTLGSITHDLNLRREERLARGFQPVWLPVDYAPSRLPWAISGSLRARRALTGALPTLDGAFIHSTTISLFAGDLARRCPTVLSTDGTAANKREMRGWYGLKPESRAAARAKAAIYRHAFRRARGFVAWCSWARRSLVEDYGCRPEDVEVIPPGVDTALFKPGPAADRLPRILFVGGDFARKGGDLLLEVFRARLRGKAELHLVTSAGLPAEPGVHLHRGIRANSPELLALYSASDLFTLPTRGDCLPLVGLEALSAGLPLVVTNVGGLPDLVREGETGHVVKMNDGAALGDALEELVRDEGLRRRMAARARAVALANFDAQITSQRLFDFVGQRCGASPRGM